MPPTRWTTLVFLALAQLMIALDPTIVNASLQAALGFGDADRQWVLTAYTLAFGALLLLGGRVSDRIGRTRALGVGVAGFAAASAMAGLAAGIGALRLARARRARSPRCWPPVLALFPVTFTGPRERGAGVRRDRRQRRARSGCCSVGY